MASVRRHGLPILVCSAVALGCASAGHGPLAKKALGGELSAAVKAYQAEFSNDGGARNDLAVAVLMRAARSHEPDERREAFTQLASLGPKAADWLLDLVQEPGPQATKVQALGLLADMGDSAAVGTLRELAGQLEPELLPIAIPHLDAKAQRSQLLSWLTAPDAATRRAACRALRELEADQQVALALADRLRLDPDASVRVAALQALVSLGGAATPAIVDALSDDDQRVRFEALSAQLSVGNEDARTRLGTMLRSDANEMAVEAARWVLLNTIQDLTEMAQGLLERALSAPLPQTRAQAAVALRSLPNEMLATVSLLRLAQEDDLNVRLQLALRHMPSDAAQKVLTSLRDCKVPSVALEAAVILAEVGDKIALERVLLARTADSGTMRARAARALAGSLHQPEAVVSLLADDNVFVRCTAARTLLADENVESA